MICGDGSKRRKEIEPEGWSMESQKNCKLGVGTTAWSIRASGTQFLVSMYFWTCCCVHLCFCWMCQTCDSICICQLMTWVQWICFMVYCSWRHCHVTICWNSRKSRWCCSKKWRLVVTVCFLCGSLVKSVYCN